MLVPPSKSGESCVTKIFIDQLVYHRIIERCGIIPLMSELDRILSLKLTRRDFGGLVLTQCLSLALTACVGKSPDTVPSPANGSREAIDSGGSPTENHFWREDGMSRFDFKFPNPRDKSTGDFTLSLKSRALNFDPGFREGTILPDLFMRVVFDASVKPFKVVQELGQILNLERDPILNARQEIILPADLDPTKPHTLFTSWERWKFGSFFWDGNSIPAKDALPTKRASSPLDQRVSVIEMIGRAPSGFEV